MKKKLIIGTSAAIVVLLSSSIFLYSSDFGGKGTIKEAKPKTQSVSSVAERMEEEQTKPSYEVPSADVDRAANEIGEVNDEKTLAHNMMIIAIQKVQLKEHENFNIYGTAEIERIQISKENIQYLKERANQLHADPCDC